MPVDEAELIQYDLIVHVEFSSTHLCHPHPVVEFHVVESPGFDADGARVAHHLFQAHVRGIVGQRRARRLRAHVERAHPRRLRGGEHAGAEGGSTGAGGSSMGDVEPSHFG